MTNSRYGFHGLLRTLYPTVVYVSDMYACVYLCVCVYMQSYGIAKITENN